MAYLRRVELNREADRVREERRKEVKLQASKSGSALVLHAKPAEGPSIWRRMFDAMTGHKSKLSIAKEADPKLAKVTGKQFRDKQAGAIKHKPHGWKKKAKA